MNEAIKYKGTPGTARDGQNWRRLNNIEIRDLLAWHFLKVLFLIIIIILFATSDVTHERHFVCHKAVINNLYVFALVIVLRS